MACDQAHLPLTVAAQPIDHPDADMHMGKTFTIRCDTAVMYLGGPNVTAANGYPQPAGQPFTLSDATDQLYVAVASGDVGKVAYVLWVGV